VSVLRKPINHCENDAVAVDLGKTLHKVHGDVSPNLGRHVERLEETGGVERLRLVPLTGGARADEVAHHGAVVVDGEVAAQPLQRALHTFVPRRVSELEDLRQGARGGRHVDAGAAEDEAGVEPLGSTTGCDDGVAEVAEPVVLLQLAS